MDLATLPRGELITYVHTLLDRIQGLESQLAQVQEQLKQKGVTGKKDGEERQVPEFVKANVKKGKRKKQRKLREQAFVRLKEKADKQVFHTTKECPHCGSGYLGKPIVSYIRQIIDLPILHYLVTEHVVCKRWCYSCKCHITPEVNWNEFAVGRRRMGVGLMSAIGVMRDRLRLPVGLIQVYLRLIYNLSISKGEIVELLHEIAKRGRSEYDSLFDALRKSASVHADETGGREDGINGYYWSYSSKEVHVLMYRHSRSGKVVEEFVGEDSEKFTGVLITDFLGSYNIYTGFHQRCWVHFLRDVKELKKSFVGRHPPLNKWAKQVKSIYEEAKKWQPAQGLQPGKEEQVRIAKQQEFEKQLEQVCKVYVGKKTPMSTLSGRAIIFLPEMFTFVRFPGVDSDNNQAERMIRPMVVKRKISGGTRSPKGSETNCIITSLFDTWQLQGKNPLIACREMLVAV